MVEFLAQTPQLLFTLALVELQIYELDQNQNKSLLIIPQTVTRTREITRAIVKIEAKEIKSINIGLIEPPPDGDGDGFFTTLGKHVNPELVAFARSIIEDIEGLGCIVEWHSASYVIKLPAPNGRKLNLSLFGIYKQGEVFIGGLAHQLKKVGLPEQIGLDYAKNTALLFKTEIYSGNPTEWAGRVKLQELWDKYDKFEAEVQKTIDQIIEAADTMK